MTQSPVSPSLPFPKDFLWGSATAAYQIEGAVKEDGRGESIWDRFCAAPGAIRDGTSGAIACDHYHRWQQDIDLMRDLGLRSYRFSVGWSRVVPTGGRGYNARGLDFYSRLVDSLLEAGIRPMVTLNHWDMPQTLEDRGGWPFRGTVGAFSDYVDVVGRCLGDRVEDFVTHNEPWVISHLGYWIGEHAPGRREPLAAVHAAHHLLVSHGLAVQILRALCPKAQVGLVLNLSASRPASPSEYDHDACRRVDGTLNRWFLDPVHGRRYPSDAVEDWTREGIIANGLDFVQEGDFETIAQPLDFLGVNYYARSVVRSDRVPEEQNAPRSIPESPASEKTDIGWEISAPGLFDVLMRVWLEYRPRKLYVTENGAAYSVGPDASGQVHDTRRLEYLRDHIAACYRALEAGVPLAGYYVWSLLDNFEWAAGLSQRFGICWVDYVTQERIVKDSGKFYATLAKTNVLDMNAEKGSSQKPCPC